MRGSAFTSARDIIERGLLSFVAIFVAMIAIGITSHAHTSHAAPRTVQFYIGQHAGAVESSPVTEGAR